MFVDDLNVLFTNPSIRHLTGAIHPGLQGMFTHIDVSAVLSKRVVQFPVIRLSPSSCSAEPEPGTRVLVLVK